MAWPFVREAEGALAALRAAHRLTVVLLLVMVFQASAGLMMRGAYRDVEWIRLTWLGNDSVTLVVGVPLAFLGLIRARAGSVRGLMLWLGLTGYAVYNYAFYLFGASLNAFFPLYVAAFVLAVTVLILTMSSIDRHRLAAECRSTAPVRLAGATLAFVAVGLSAVWVAFWGLYVFAGRPTPVDPNVFKIVAALDLSLMVPVLLTGGLFVWKRKPWGPVIAAIGSIQATLYLFVLSVNSLILVQRDLVRPPGELPIFGPLTIVTATVAGLILHSAPPRASVSPFAQSGRDRAPHE